MLGRTAVCGVSKRMRLDVVVNALTFQALKYKIKVFGGSQKRPNIHIDDITDLYIFFLNKNLSLVFIMLDLKIYQ